MLRSEEHVDDSRIFRPISMLKLENLQFYWSIIEKIMYVLQYTLEYTSIVKFALPFGLSKHIESA